MLSGMVFVMLLCFRLLRYVLTRGCMCIMFDLVCVLLMVHFVLLSVVYFLNLGVACCDVMWCCDFCLICDACS